MEIASIRSQSCYHEKASEAAIGCPYWYTWSGIRVFLEVSKQSALYSSSSKTGSLLGYFHHVNMSHVTQSTSCFPFLCLLCGSTTPSSCSVRTWLFPWFILLFYSAFRNISTASIALAVHHDVACFVVSPVWKLYHRFWFASSLPPAFFIANCQLPTMSGIKERLGTFGKKMLSKASAQVTHNS